MTKPDDLVEWTRLRELAGTATGTQWASLDAAWAEAEAALPEGGRLHLQRRAEATEEIQPDGTVWVARQGRAAGAYEAWATNTTHSLGFAYAATPTAALLVLAARLREQS